MPQYAFRTELRAPAFILWVVLVSTMTKTGENRKKTNANVIIVYFLSMTSLLQLRSPRKKLMVNKLGLSNTTVGIN